MRYHRLFLLASVLVSLLALPAHASRLVIGSNLGVSYLTSADSDGLVMINVPSGGQNFLPTFQPGFRLGTLDDAGRGEFFADLALSVVNGSGETIYGVLFTGNYQHHFTPDQPTSPYLNVGAGLGRIGGNGESFDQLVYGAGFGLRINFGHGHGAGRVEARLDIFDPTEEFADSVTAFGMRFGFDLYGGE